MNDQPIPSVESQGELTDIASGRGIPRHQPVEDSYYIQTLKEIWDGFIAQFGPLGEFVVEYQLFIFLGILSIFLFAWARAHVKKRKDQIQKLWNYTFMLIFKRQMTIPLIYRLAQKDKFLTDDDARELMTIYEQCRGQSFKKNPPERFKLEKKVSTILYTYFVKLERNGLIKEESKFQKILHDLEFIDSKLTELQIVYNTEVLKWNKMIGYPFFGWILFLFGFRKMKTFDER